MNTFKLKTNERKRSWRDSWSCDLTIRPVFFPISPHSSLTLTFRVCPVKRGTLSVSSVRQSLMILFFVVLCVILTVYVQEIKNKPTKTELSYVNMQIYSKPGWDSFLSSFFLSLVMLQAWKVMFNVGCRSAEERKQSNQVWIRLQFQ